jgi:diguanylate cyclase (GGDEF)-like protein/PAS domain S-box-containing protein
MTTQGGNGGGADLLARSVLDTIEDGIVVIDGDLNILLANDALERLRPSKMPLTGKKCYEVFRDRQDMCPGCPCPEAIRTGEPQTMLFEDECDGTTRYYETTAYRLQDHDGRVVGAVEHTKDITEHRLIEQQLRDEINRRRMMVEQSRDGIVVLDQNGAVYEANERFAQTLGYTMDEVYQLKVFDWEVAFPKEVVLQMIATVDEAGDHFETRHKRKDGTFLDVEISSNGAFYGGQKLIFCVCRDITEKKAMERQIRELAIRDCLTNVYNRRYIFERLAEMVSEHSRSETNFCVSILDVDHFKSVNDIHGHQAGDFALKEFAQTVASMIRQYDLLGRYGGEEFIIVSRTASAWETAAMIERIMETVRRRAFVFEGREVRFTFSCGLAESAEFARETLTLEAIVRLADERLYDAKAAGRNRCIGPVGLLQGSLEASGLR